jgi:predicted enzyme related to lactoylglutathione lyase
MVDYEIYFTSQRGIMTNISGLDFITILVSDLEATYKFYKEKLNLPDSTERQPNAHAFATRPCAFAIRQKLVDLKIEHPGQGILIWLRATDSTALYNELRAQSVPIVEDLRKSPFGMTFSFKDPNGYVISVHDGG